MISPDFKFKEFLSAIEKMDYQQIIDTASHECGEVDRASAAHVKGGVKARARGADKYHQELKNFLHFLRWVGQDSQPLHEPERSLYRPVCEALVKKGQTPSSILGIFK